MNKIQLQNSNAIKDNRILRDIIVDNFLNNFLPDYKNDLVFNGMMDSNRLIKHLLISKPTLSSRLSYHRDEIPGFKFENDKDFKEFKKEYTDKGLITTRIVKYNFRLFNEKEVLRLLLLLNINYREKAFELLVNKFSNILILDEKTELSKNKKVNIKNNNCHDIGTIFESLKKSPKQTVITLLQTFDFNKSDNEYINIYVSKILDTLRYSTDIISFHRSFLIYQLKALATNKSCIFSEENLKRIYEEEYLDSTIIELELFKFTK